MEKTRSTETTCAVGERFARELRSEPLELARTVSLGLVPVGFQLAQTGTNLKTWCPAGRIAGRCIHIQDGQGYGEPENSDPVMVRSHQGYLGRTGGDALLVVVDVMSTTGLAPVTVIDSSSPPTVIVASTRATKPIVKRKSLSTYALKPASSNAIRYTPAGSSPTR